MPKINPEIVPKTPIREPQMMNIRTIEFWLNPIVRNIPISFLLFLTSIIRPEIMLRAAIKITSDKIINITRLSTSRALRKAPE